MSELYLQHYGVLGMKWGIRKDRNKVELGRHRRIKKYDIPKGATMYRAVRNGSTKFMDRGYTYVNNTDKLYEHSEHTSSGFGGEFDSNVKMKTTKKLKIASTDDYFDAVMKSNKLDVNEYLKDIPDEVIKKGKNAILTMLPGQLTIGDGGMFPMFNDAIEYLKKEGFDGVIDPADGANQLRDGKNPISTVIFDPRKNVKIEKVTSFY